MPLDVRTLDHAALVDALLPSVLEAGRVEMRHYASGFTVETKADNSPVTIADREAEAVLLAALAEVAPGTPVVAEEEVAAGRIPAAADVLFLVDPLDGTREFINRNGEFTVNVALVAAGRPVFGIVYAPAIGDLYATTGAATAVHAPARPHGPRRRRQPLAHDTGGGGVACPLADRGAAQRRLVAEVLPRRPRRGRRLSAARTDQRMGHGGR